MLERGPARLAPLTPLTRASARLTPLIRLKWPAPARKALPAGAVVVRQNNSAKGPVSRILSCAVIPLDAASPRTFISDLPGGFGKCSSRLGAPGRCAAPPGSSAGASLPIWSCSVWGLPCPGPYRTGGALLPHHFTLTPALVLAGRAYPSGGPGRPSRKRGSRGGIFSVALAVHEPSSSRPGRYPAHCPAEFGLSSPGGASLRTPSGSDRPVLLPRSSLARMEFLSEREKEFLRQPRERQKYHSFPNTD